MIEQIRNYIRNNINPMGACLAFILGFALTGFVTQLLKALGF